MKLEKLKVIKQKLKVYWQLIKDDPKNIWYYIQGYYRYWFRKTFLIRKHIKQQFLYRKENMEVKCLSQGECILCTCTSLPLLMADKACAKSKLPKELLAKPELLGLESSEICFGKMMNRQQWIDYKVINFKDKKLQKIIFNL